MHTKASSNASIAKDKSNNYRAGSRITLKGNKIVDKRVSVCTDCRSGIFEHHEYLWTSRGLVHKECDEVKNAT